MLFNINISALPLVSKQSGRCSLPFVPNTYKKRPILLMPMEVLAPGSGHADPPLGPHEQKFSGPRVWSGGDTKLFIHSSFSLFKWRLLPKLPGRALNVLAVRLTLHHPWGGTPIFFIIFHLVGSISTCADGGPRSQSVHAWVLGYKKVS